MMLSESQLRWIVYFILFEFIIILFFILASYLSKLYFYIKKKTNKRAYDKLKELIISNQPIPPRLVKKIEIVLALLKQINPDDLPDGEQKKSELVRDSILPQARQFINKRSWEKRYQLLSCFDYYINLQDYGLLIRLIKDNNPTISFNAMRIASKIGTPELLKAILDNLKSKAHIVHAFAEHFLLPSPDWAPLIGKELNTTDDPWLKKICYEVLRVAGGTPEYFDRAKSDCYSDNINVRLAAIRAIPYIDKNRYLELFNQLIHDNHWMIRNAVVKTLRELQDPGSLSLLEDALKDREWWVRINAAKSLTYFGDAGTQILAKHTKEHKAAEADYFIKIQQVRDEADDD